MKSKLKKNMEFRKKGNTVGSLTQKEESIIIGSTLGDGYLRIVSGRKNALFEINSSIREKEYVDWKYQALKRIVITPPRRRKGNGKRVAYRFSTRQHPDLTKIYQKFYCDRKKFIPEFQLNPLIIAVWFMDDGSKTYNSYYLNAQGFDYPSQEKLVRMLKEQYGIKSSLNRDKIYYRIRIRTESAGTLRELINPYVIPTMKYKLGETP